MAYQCANQAPRCPARARAPAKAAASGPTTTNPSPGTGSAAQSRRCASFAFYQHPRSRTHASASSMRAFVTSSRMSIAASFEKCFFRVSSDIRRLTSSIDLAPARERISRSFSALAITASPLTSRAAGIVGHFSRPILQKRMVSKTPPVRTELRLPERAAAVDA